MFATCAVAACVIVTLVVVVRVVIALASRLVVALAARVVVTLAACVVVALAGASSLSLLPVVVLVGGVLCHWHLAIGRWSSSWAGPSSRVVAFIS
jgi:hypothetical protein